MRIQYNGRQGMDPVRTDGFGVRAAGEPFEVPADREEYAHRLVATGNFDVVESRRRPERDEPEGPIEA